MFILRAVYWKVKTFLNLCLFNNLANFFVNCIYLPMEMWSCEVALWRFLCQFEEFVPEDRCRKWASSGGMIDVTQECQVHVWGTSAYALNGAEHSSLSESHTGPHDCSAGGRGDQPCGGWGGSLLRLIQKIPLPRWYGLCVRVPVYMCVWSCVCTDIKGISQQNASVRIHCECFEGENHFWIVSSNKVVTLMKFLIDICSSQHLVWSSQLCSSQLYATHHCEIASLRDCMSHSHASQ